MRSSLLVSGMAALWLAVGGTAVQACEGDKTLFEDSFDTLDPTWGAESNSFSVKDGQLRILPDPDQAYYSFSNFGFFDDVDYCASVISVNADLSGASFAGLIFWGVDSDNYYSFVITADGFAAVFRRQKGKSLTQVDWTKFDAIEKGEDANNQVRVLIKGKTATLYVNGTKFRQVTGKPPDNGWQFGLRAASPKNSRATYGFDDIKLTQ